MILRRLGNKKKLAKKLQTYFPPHKIYIEPFFGAGGMFFNKPKAKYNIVNDLDSDVFNLFQVVEPIKKALRFLLMSNFTYMGKMDCIKWAARNEKESFYKKIDLCFEYFYGCRFNNCDFKKFLNDLQINETDIKRNQTFIYSDPPYLETVDTYSDSDTWKQSDSSDLFDSLQKTGCKFAYSEFDHPFILQQAKERKLNVHIIGERQNLKNRRIEILVTNYELNQLKLF